MADCVLFILIDLHIPVVRALLGDFNICDPEEGRFNVWNQSFTNGEPTKTAVFHSFFFPHVLEVARSDYTRRDSTALGVTRTLSRIDRIFINLLSWMSKHAVFCSPLQRFTMIASFLLIRLVRSQNFKLFLTSPRSSRFMSSDEKHLTASGPTS